MAERIVRDCTAIILAGGQGTRLKRLGRFISKAALIVGDHLDHLIEAGWRQIIVSTNPLHYPALNALLASYCETLASEGVSGVELTLLENAAHLDGPTEGLSVALEKVTTRRCLIVLVDEYIRANPFPDFAAQIDAVDEFGGVAPLADERETRRGGYVQVRQGWIVGYVERTGIVDAQGLPSTGALLADSEHLRADVAAFLAAHPPGESIGDCFDERVRLRGRRVRALVGPDFVNINTQDSLLLANLYAAADRHPPGSPLYDALNAAAHALRRQIAETG